MAIIAREAEIKPGYKLTEVGVIPEEWRVSKVGAEFEIQLGKMLDAEKNTGLPKPYIGNKAVQWNHIDLSGLQTMAMSRSDLERFRLRFGDLLVCEGGEIGRAAIWEAPIEECYYQKALHRLHPLRGFSPRLMLALLQYWTDHEKLADYVSQTSIAHLTREKLIEVPMPVPTPKEQQAIVTALSDVDALITSLDKLIAKKRDIKQATMQQLLTGKIRLPGFSKGLKQFYKQTEVGIIPEDWEVHTLGDEIDQLEAGVSVNSVDEDFHVYAHEQAILKTSAVSNGYFLPYENKKIAPRDIKRAKLNPRINSIIISRMNTPDLVGECGYVDTDYPNIFLPDRLWMTRFKRESKINVRWLSYLLNSKEYKIKIKLAATGTSGSMKNISKDSLLSINIPFPTPDEQTAIATVLSDMDAEITALEQKRDKIRVLKQGMMQELLTGKTRLL